jgi:hypothetical protein
MAYINVKQPLKTLNILFFMQLPWLNFYIKVSHLMYKKPFKTYLIYIGTLDALHLMSGFAWNYEL